MLLNDFWSEFGIEIIISSVFILVSLGLLMGLIFSLGKKNASKKFKIIGGIIFVLVLLSVNFIMLRDYQNKLAKDPNFMFPLARVLIFNAFIIFAFVIVGYILTTKKQQEKVTVATVATLGLLTALASVLMLFGIPIFPQASYLKVEVSALIYFMVFLWFGIKPTIVVILLTNFIHALMPSMTPPVILFLDEMVNVVACLTYLTPSFIAFGRLKDNEVPSINKVIITAIIGVVFTAIFMLLYNYFINLPLIYKIEMDFKSVFLLFVPFNLIKWSSVSIVVVLLYRKINSLKEHIVNFN